MRLFDLKRALRQHLHENDIKSIAALAKQDRRVINILMSFSYDKEAALSWRAIRAVGEASRVLLDEDYEFLRDTTRRLIWSVTEESGNVAWSSVEMLSEIVASDIKRFSDLIPIIVSMYEEEIFREGVMYGLARFADLSPSLVAPYEPVVREALSDDNPRVRFYSLECVKKTDMIISEATLERLCSDESVAKIYTGNTIEEIKIKERFCVD